MPITLHPSIAHALERVTADINSFASLDDDERAILRNAAHELLILANERDWSMERATARILALISAYAVVNPPAYAGTLVLDLAEGEETTPQPNVRVIAPDTFVLHRGEQTLVVEK